MARRKDRGVGSGGEGRAPIDRLSQAAELLAAGAWQQAHEIVQQDESAQAAWLHGIVHTLEGDLDNARHWYRKADRVFPGPGAVQEEIAAARKLVTAGSP